MIQHKTIDGLLLRDMVVAGAALLEKNREAVDALNVFPVPDGDTGTNMSLTMQSATREVNAQEYLRADEAAAAISKGALKGARGNSGVITSQLLRGFATSLKGVEKITPVQFAQALKAGSDKAYKAVMKPKEGTILTVARVIAEDAIKYTESTPDDYDGLMNVILTSGEAILKRTPDMLPPLKAAGVVDSGGYGIIMIFKGMLKGYRNEEIEGAEDYVPTPVSLNLASGSNKLVEDIQIDYENLDDIEFAYCTEFFIINLKKKTTVSDIDKLREKFNNIGDSTLVIGDLSLVKVHVHTNNPGTALSYALQLGEVDKIKIENMLEQNRELKAKYEAERKNIGILTICSGEGMASIFKDLGVDRVVEGGQTMNPSTADILDAVDKVNAKTIFVLPNNKNIILAANQAAELMTDKELLVIPTKTIPQGITAVINFVPELSVEENEETMLREIKNVKTGQVTYAVRDTVIDDKEIKKDDFMGIGDQGIVAVGTDMVKVTRDMIAELVDEDSELISVYYGCDVAEDAAEALRADLEEAYPACDIELQYGGQPIYYYTVSVE